MKIQKYNFYEESDAERAYDEIAASKVFIPKGSDAYTEFMESLGVGRGLFFRVNDPNRKTLDEWAADFRVSTSRLIEMLTEALHPEDRLEEDARIEEEYREYCELATACGV